MLSAHPRINFPALPVCKLCARCLRPLAGFQLFCSLFGLFVHIQNGIYAPASQQTKKTVLPPLPGFFSFSLCAFNSSPHFFAMITSYVKKRCWNYKLYQEVQSYKEWSIRYIKLKNQKILQIPRYRYYVTREKILRPRRWNTTKENNRNGAKHKKFKILMLITISCNLVVKLVVLSLGNFSSSISRTKRFRTVFKTICIFET